AAFAEQAGHSVLGPEELMWRARIRAELDNLRAAVTWSLDAHDDADAELGLSIVVGLAVQQGYDPALGIGQWALRALDRVGTTTPARRQVVRAAAAYGSALAGDFSRARDLVIEALHEGVPDDSPWPSYAAYTLAYVQVLTGEPERVLETVEGAIEELGDRLGPMDLVTLHSVAAPTASYIGDQARAVTHAKQALELGRRTGSPSGIASSLFAYGLTMRAEDPQAARAALEESIALVERGATPVVYGYALLA